MWSAGNLIIPYFIGRFGAFGMPPDQIAHPVFSILGMHQSAVCLMIQGVVCGFLALVANIFIKTQVESVTNQGHQLIQDTDGAVNINAPLMV